MEFRLKSLVCRVPIFFTILVIVKLSIVSSVLSLSHFSQMFIVIQATVFLCFLDLFIGNPPKEVHRFFIQKFILHSCQVWALCFLVICFLSFPAIYGWQIRRFSVPEVLNTYCSLCISFAKSIFFCIWLCMISYSTNRKSMFSLLRLFLSDK